MSRAGGLAGQASFTKLEIRKGSGPGKHIFADIRCKIFN